MGKKAMFVIMPSFEQHTLKETPLIFSEKYKEMMNTNKDTYLQGKNRTEWKSQGWP